MKDFQEVLENVYEKKLKIIGDGGSVCFRGQSDSSWGLWSTVHRFVNQVTAESSYPMTPSDIQSLLRREEKSAFYRFKSAASPFLDQLQRSDWGYVFAMQHYGLPSRLLDWTDSFACALFFANAGWDRTTNSAIFVLNPSTFNEESIGTWGEVILDCDLKQTNIQLEFSHPSAVAPDAPLGSFAVQPVYTNPRMVVQQARFTICGDLCLPLETQFPTAIDKLELTPDMANDIDKFLSLVGMDWASYFPDIEGISKQNKVKEGFTMAKVRENNDDQGM